MVGGGVVGGGHKRGGVVFGFFLRGEHALFWEEYILTLDLICFSHVSSFAKW